MLRFWPPLGVLLATGTVSSLGNIMSQITILWFVLATSGSESLAGLSAAFMALPLAVSGILGGTIADRLGFKATGVFADLASCGSLLLIAIVHQLFGVEFWQLLFFIFLGSALDAPGEAARQSLVPQLSIARGVSLERANGFNESLKRLSLITGPLIAGLLIAAVGPVQTLSITGAMFLVSAATMWVGVPSERKGHAESHAADHVSRKLNAGFRFLRADNEVRSLMILMTMAYSIGTPLLAVVMPVYAEHHLESASRLGALLAAFAVGALAGSLLFGVAGQRLPRLAVFRISFLFASVPIVILATVPSFAVAIAALAVRGLAFGPANPLVMTVFQERIPEALRGRVLSIYLALSSAAVAFSLGTFGVGLEQLGMQVTLIVASVIFFCLVAATWLSSSLTTVFVPIRAKPAERR